MLFFVLDARIKNSLDNYDIFSVIIAALGHDVGHLGLTNRYLVQTGHALALEYNDISVLENMHCSLIFKIMNIPECGVFQSFPQVQWIKSRKLIIDMVLSTDMAKHFEILGKFRTRALHLADIDLTKDDDKILVLSIMLKAGDVGYCGKIPSLHRKWSELVFEESFRQGDLEREQGLPVSMYCDRSSTNIHKSNLGFISNIALPIFEVCVQWVENKSAKEIVIIQTKKNLENWQSGNKERRATAIYVKSSTNNVDIESLMRRQSVK